MQLHPVQYNYFNFLVDRTTPEYLRTQYRLDYCQLAAKGALERLLESHPGEALVVRARGTAYQRSAGGGPGAFAPGRRPERRL